MDQKQIKQSQQAVEKAIEYFGTQEKLASVLGVSQSTISKWLTNLKQISFKSAYKIDELTNGKITIHDLRPDLNVKVKRK